jgi:hypothetical protein
VGHYVAVRRAIDTCRGENLEIRWGIGSPHLKEEAPSLELTDLGAEGVGLADSGELMKARPRHPRGQPTVTTGGLGESASGFGDSSEDANVDGLGLGVTQQRARNVAEAVRVEVG